MRFVIGLLCIAFAAPVLATPHQLDALTPGGDPPQSNIIITSWAYPNCDPMGIDYEASSGLIWVADQGGTASQGECPPNGQIRTFDPVTGTWTLKFVISEIFGPGFEDVAANGIEVVGDHVYVADYNGDVVNMDDSIYKFTKTGTLVAAYDIAYALDQCVGLGYQQGVFFVTTVFNEVFGFIENEAGGTMDLVLTSMITGVAAGGGGLDWDELCNVWLHVDFRNLPTEVYVLDSGFNLLGAYDSEIANPIGVTYGPPFMGLATQYVISRDDELIYKTNDHAPCAGATPVENSTWGGIKGLYR